MTDGQGKDRRSMGGETPRSMRGPHPAAGPTVSLSLASWLPARTRAWPTILFVPLASSLASNPSATTVRRDAAGMHVAQAARAFGTAAKQRALWVHQQRVSRLYVRPAAGAAASLRHQEVGCDGTHPLAASTGIAMRIATVLAGCDSKRARARIVAAKMVLPLACPAGCPRAGDRRLRRRHRRDLEAL